MFLAAVVQLTGSSDEAACWEQTNELVRRAAATGATLIGTPECTNYLGPHDKKVRIAEPIEGPTVQRYRDLAAELGIHLLIGSVNEKAPDPDRCYNTSVFIGPDGRILQTYRKVHLFDVDVEGGVTFSESKTTVRGNEPRVVQTDLGTVGLSICYDLRFPEHYRALINRGASILAVPSAFTERTGRDHWEPLLKARAIECQAYVLAPGQFGPHDDGGLRASYGHSMIVDPWGLVVARCSDGPGFAVAEIDPDRVTRVRRGMPCAEHRVLDFE